LKFGIQPEVEKTTVANPSESEVAEDSKKKSAELRQLREDQRNKMNNLLMEADFANCLSSLFRLPLSYLDANNSELDEELVDYYAQELQLVSNISSAVAYGVALDTYLSDPVQFRHRVGKMALPEDHFVDFLDSTSGFDEDDDLNTVVGFLRLKSASITSFLMKQP